MKLLLSAVLITLLGISGNAQINQKPEPATQKTGDVEVYYFHMSVRCVTCKTVEAEARKNVEMLYPEQVKAGKISFTALNLEEATGKSMGERLGVNSQTLLIVKGDQKINITNEGFLYAVSQPQKFTEVMKSKIDPLIK
ncbi:MAG TPA: nitrophenyl compound nitroreductase subunit ArsF family protein [Bacteroidales bacterium]|nr:nitrophenyl compound nitroreductase subunit ArsF family protein [Bacteroidales bacterium]